MKEFEIIYETKGKAKEYAPLGVELYSGCRYGCRYCFVPKTLNISAEEFHTNNGPVTDALNKLKKDAELLKAKQDDREILLCFHSEPYQDFYEGNKNITGQAIEILIENNLRFTILTKSGLLGTYHFDLLRGYEKFSFGTTLIFIDQGDANKWEPNAAAIDLRIEAIKKARNKEIKTWVSIEPVIDPKQALELIKKYHPIVDHWKIGKINYHPEIEEKVDWIRFREEVKSLLDSLGADYYLKKSLTEFPWTEGDISTRKGNCNILVIAPHGHKKDDENTYEMARHIADDLDCYAVVNELYQKPPYKKKMGILIKNKHTGIPVRRKANKNEGWIDLNNLPEIEDHLDEKDFLGPITDYKNEIIKRFGAAQVFILHGIGDASILDENKLINAAPRLDALIGIGRGNPNEDPPYEERLSASPESAINLIELLHNDIIATEALPRRNRRSYAGWDRRNLNQLFTERNDNDPNVHSVQIEIKWTGYREPANIQNTAGIFAEAFAKMHNFKAMGILPSPDEDDIALVDRAYAKLSDIFYFNIGNAIYEAGKFIVKEFYNDEIELATNQSPTKEQPLNKLIKKIQDSSHKKPSRSWIFNAVKLYAETKELETTVQTYGQLPVSHKILLFSVRNRDTKIQLIQETVENNYTVVALKNRIAELMTAEKPKIEAPKSLLQVVTNPDLLFSDNYALDRDVKSLSKLKSAQLEKIHTRITEKLERIEEKLNEFQTAVETHKGHLKQYKRFITSVEAAKKKLPK